MLQPKNAGALIYFSISWNLSDQWLLKPHRIGFHLLRFFDSLADFIELGTFLPQFTQMDISRVFLDRFKRCFLNECMRNMFSHLNNLISALRPANEGMTKKTVCKLPTVIVDWSSRSHKLHQQWPGTPFLGQAVRLFVRLLGVLSSLYPGTSEELYSSHG